MMYPLWSSTLADGAEAMVWDCSHRCNACPVLLIKRAGQTEVEQSLDVPRKFFAVLRTVAEVEAAMGQSFAKLVEIARRRERQEALAKARKARAEARAAKLLERLLPPEEWQRWRYSRIIHVTGSRGNAYVIHPGISGNVEAVESRRRWCAGPRDVPLSDFILTQYLWLKHREAEFLKIAR